MEESLLTYRGAVYPWHCDHVGHMNNMWYAGKFDEASWNLMLQLGISPSYLRTTARGMVAVEQLSHFMKEVLAGDVVEVRTRVLEVRDKVVRIVHTMQNAETGQAVATCTITCVHFDRHTRKSCPLPADIRATAQRLVEIEDAAQLSKKTTLLGASCTE
jgi:acyl-CoA thioester hydrolase